MNPQKEDVKGKANDLLEVTPASEEAIVSNKDVLIEILLRVPTKSLIQFKCVSKYWLSLISDPLFGYNHTARNSKSLSALYFHSSSFSYLNLKPIPLHGNLSLPTLTFLDNVAKGPAIHVVDACNGLMLCSQGYDELYNVCNLTTQKYTILPQPARNFRCVFLSCLAFDPTRSPYYKVVLIRNSSFGSYPIDIYSSENTSWKYVYVTAALGNPFIFCAFWNGAVHWMNNKNIHLQFKVDAEKLTGTPMPPNLKILSEGEIHYFGECGGNLLLAQDQFSIPRGFRILEMKRGTWHWIVKQRLNFWPFIRTFSSAESGFHVLSILEGSHESDIILMLATKQKVISYHPKYRTIEVHCDFLPNDFLGIRFHQKGGAFKYIESLSPV